MKKETKKKVIKEENVETQEYPVIESVSVVQLQEGPDKGQYVSIVVSTQNDKVVSIKTGTPNVKQVAVDEAKSVFVKKFVMG